MKICSLCSGSGKILENIIIYVYEPVQITNNEYESCKNKEELNKLIDDKFEYTKITMKSRIGIL